MRLALVTNICTHYRRPLFEALAERFDAHFYFTSKRQEWYRSPSTPTEAAAFDAFSETRPVPLARALTAGAYDCIVVNLAGRSTLLAAVAAARWARRPLVLWIGIWSHPTTAFHRLSRPVVRSMYRRADSLVVYGPHVTRHIAAESGRTKDIFEAPHAVDNALFRRGKKPGGGRTRRADLRVNPGSLACFVGRLEREKGLETLIHALALTTAPQTLVLIGSGSFESRLRALADSLGITDRIRFVGHVSQEILPTYLQSVDFLVLPSITTNQFKEPWGLVINEAMNSGLPVIATDAVGAVAGGLVVDNETGCVVGEGDAIALARAMDELAINEGERVRLGTNGAERVLHWNIDAAARVFEQAIVVAVERRGQKVDLGRQACAS